MAKPRLSRSEEIAKGGWIITVLNYCESCKKCAIGVAERSKWSTKTYRTVSMTACEACFDKEFNKTPEELKSEKLESC